MSAQLSGQNRIFGLSRALLCVAISICSTDRLRAQGFTFAYCQDAQKHISVQWKGDHYLVHCHVRVTGMAGQQFFARVRTAMPNQEGHLQIVSDSMKPLKADAGNELWSLYFRTPRFAVRERQNAAIYQLEFGEVDPTQVDEYTIHESFAWKVTRNATGGGAVVAGPDILIPIRVRVARIVGSSIEISTETRVRTSVSDLTYGLTGWPGDEAVNEERAAQLIE